jgi:hypothetical protein
MNLCKSTRCGYEVTGIIILQTYLYTNNLLRGGVTFEALPFNSYAFIPTVLPLLETLWNSCCGMAFSVLVTFFSMTSVASL